MIYGRKYKILITGPDITKFSGGIQTHVKNFIEVFSDHNEIELSFFPTTLGLYNNESWISKAIRNLLIIYPLIKEVSNSDLIHLNSTFDNRSVVRDTFYILIILFLKKKIIIQFHGGRPKKMSLFRNIFLHKVMGIIFKKCNKILILSKEQEQEFKFLFPKIPTKIINNFINTKKYKKNRRGDNCATVFLFLGRIDEAKGVKQIIKAALILRDRHINYKIWFCGKGPLSNWLDDAIRNNNLKYNVCFKGVVSGKEKKDILNSSDILILPSKHDEGFPYSILEAFCYNMPVISTCTGAISDIIKVGKNGFLIDYNDVVDLSERMIYFCVNKKQIVRMGKLARDQVENEYSYEQMDTIFSTLYKQVINMVSL